MIYNLLIAHAGTGCCLNPKGDVKVKLLGSVLLFIGVGSVAFANAVPEIGPASAGSAIALISGAVLVMRGRRKK